MKAILVLDEMPECCEKCPVFYRIPGDFGCGVSSHHMMDWVDRPDWCPLRPLPKSKWEPDEADNYCGGYADGWNVCLDAILKEAEEE